MISAEEWKSNNPFFKEKAVSKSVGKLAKAQVDFGSLVRKRANTYQFGSADVPDSAVEKILEAARWAPSCANKQPWHFIVVRKKESVARLGRAAYHVFFPPLKPLPPVVIAFVLKSGEFLQGGGCIGPPDYGVEEAKMCVAMAMLSAALQATEMGFDTCILTPRERVNRLLGVRENDSVPLLLGIGHGSKTAKHKKPGRKKLSSLVSAETYSTN